MDCSLEVMGKRIAERRNKLHISQEKLAEQVGCSNNHLSNIEQGRAVPSLKLFIRICNSLVVSPDYLLMGSLHPRNVPQNLIDSLSLCSEEDISRLEGIVNVFVEHSSKKWNDDHYI